MAGFLLGPKDGLRLAVMAAAIAIVTASSAMAAGCKRVNGGWTNKFNKNPATDCDGVAPPNPSTGPTAECSILANMKLCCTDPSPGVKKSDCINQICQDNETFLSTVLGINTARRCY